jgi:uncharacterized membrane protein YvlD (DUF360 family)
MTMVLQPLLVSKYGMFESTKNRFEFLWEPIQRTSYKSSDLFKFFTRPIIDVISMPIFAYDCAVSLVNCLVSFLNAVHLWTCNRQGKAHTELDVAGQHLKAAISAVVALFVNPIVSILSLITRPLASAVALVGDLCCGRPTA